MSDFFYLQQPIENHTSKNQTSDIKNQTSDIKKSDIKNSHIRDPSYNPFHFAKVELPLLFRIHGYQLSKGGYPLNTSIEMNGTLF